MNNTLGAYIRFIPAVDQDTIAKCISIHRQTDVHRGMLSFIPVDELIEAVRSYMSPSNSYAQGLPSGQQQAYQAQAYQAVAAAQYNYPRTLAGAGSATNYPYQGALYPSANTAYPHITQEGRTFAYTALMVARGIMLKDEDECETVQNEHDVSENVEENNSKII